MQYKPWTTLQGQALFEIQAGFHIQHCIRGDKYWGSKKSGNHKHEINAPTFLYNSKDSAAFHLACSATFIGIG
jgi:hypothetical protein